MGLWIKKIIKFSTLCLASSGSMGRTGRITKSLGSINQWKRRSDGVALPAWAGEEGGSSACGSWLCSEQRLCSEEQDTPLAQAEKGLFVRRSAPWLAQPTPGKEDLSFLCRWQVEKRYLLEVELVVDGNQFIQNYMNDLHKSSFILNQLLIQFFITSQFLSHPGPRH